MKIPDVKGFFFYQSGSSSCCILLSDQDVRLTDKVTHTFIFYGFSGGGFPYFQVVSGRRSL